MEFICPWESPQYFIFSSNIPTLLYYSHFIAILIAGIFAYMLFSKIRESLTVRLLLTSILLFVTWTLIDVFLWASNRADLVLFYWSLQILLETLLYSSAFYLTFTFVKKKDLNLKNKIFLSLGILPIVILLPSIHLLPGIDVSYCNAIESSFVIFYTYLFQIILSLSILFLCFKEINKNISHRKEISLFTAGIIIFLIAFSSGNIIGSITENWALAQAGLFGMPVFITFLTYTIVKFKTFNVKLFGARALVFALWVLVGSILFVQTLENVRIITSVTLIVLLILGIGLVRSVRKEIEQKERIEKLAIDLEKANARLRELDTLKSEFLSFASHQLRSPLTAMHGHTSMLIEGDFGEIPQKIKEPIEIIDQSTTSLIKIVNDFLNISRIEQGRMQYDYVDFNTRDLVEEVIAELRPNVESKGLTFEFSAEEDDSYLIHADKGKLKQVIGNIIDNSIKYTPSGGIKVHVGRVNNFIKISVKDTGIGIDPVDVPKLFSKFGRTKDAHKTNITGTGLGLYVAKQMIEAQKGKIWVESHGKGSGSTFFIEFEAKS